MAVIELHDLHGTAIYLSPTGGGGMFGVSFIEQNNWMAVCRALLLAALLRSVVRT